MGLNALLLRTAGAQKEIGQGKLIEFAESAVVSMIGGFNVATGIASAPLLTDVGGIFMDGNAVSQLVTPTPTPIINWTGVMPTLRDYIANPAAGTIIPTNPMTALINVHLSVDSTGANTYTFQLFFAGLPVPHAVAVQRLQGIGMEQVSIVTQGALLTGLPLDVRVSVASGSNNLTVSNGQFISSELL